MEKPGAVYCLSNASELPSVPIFAASVIRDNHLPKRFVHVLEPRRPIASALRACIKENELDSLTRVLQASAGVYRPNKKAAEDGPGGVAQVLLAPGVEDIASVGKALEDVMEAHENLLAPGARVIPSAVSFRAVGVTVPAQTDLVRAPLGTVSGFDLSSFNKFRGEAPVDLIRLRDIKYTKVTEEAELMNISLEEKPLEGEDGEGLLRGMKLEGMVLELHAVADGELTAVAVWTDCMMGDEVLSGGADQLCRRQMVSFLPAPLSVSKGSTVQLNGAYDASTGHFKFVSSAVVTNPAGHAPAADGAPKAAVSMSVERWHFPMINDERRNQAYDAAIKKCMQGHRVVDIGGGSGLLAMMAARAGADQVVTVERVGDMAECATRVLDSNGFGDTIKVVHGSSLDLKPEALGIKDGARPTVVLSEVLDDGLLGEGVIPTVAHARRELAVPNALVIPAAAKVWAMVVAMPSQPEPIIMPATSTPKNCAAQRWHAYDTMRPPEMKKYTSLRLDRIKFTPLTAPFPVFGFDFDAPLDDPASAADYSREQDIQVNATATGTANAVVFWFTLTLNRNEDETTPADICTYPAMAEQCNAAESSRCWNEACQFVEPADLETGKAFTLQAAHNPTRVFFRNIVV
jgi:type II protein arginine methyltransferase